ncbi:hypothetical protein DdX_21588 [Ditylenchus destructor]|uniref:Uncharacterized protein n=1 Tax=Ditylenchus destructor TaxID=166010 RepID=A0AAD4MIV1_9BILA|nr:hypothetical protein DdX_21588 [Ditylenchus destructor]
MPFSTLRSSTRDARRALIGQKRLDHVPLEIGQVIAAHADAESAFAALAARTQLREKPGLVEQLEDIVGLFGIEDLVVASQASTCVRSGIS